MTEYPTPMGEEIESVEESSENSPKPLIKKPNPTELLIKLKSFLTRLKKPRVFTLAILFLTIILISIALNLLSRKNKEDVIPPPDFQSSAPSPNTSQEPSTENIAQRVEIYNKKLNTLKNFNEDLPKPIVDLDISFK